MLEIAHSCCPGKTDINAPMFEKTDNAITTQKGTMQLWTCKGCKTVIIMAHPGDAKQ
jgi:hypothetical protein